MAHKQLPSVPQLVSESWFPLLFYLVLVSVILYYYIVLILIQVLHGNCNRLTVYS